MECSVISTAHDGAFEIEWLVWRKKKKKKQSSVIVLPQTIDVEQHSFRSPKMLMQPGTLKLEMPQSLSSHTNLAASSSYLLAQSES